MVVAVELAAAADLVRRLGRVCGSCDGRDDALQCGGRWLPGRTTRSPGAAGRRDGSGIGCSHLWAPLSTAVPDGDTVVLDARKSWVTSAGEVDSYVWSSRPMTDGAGPMSLWYVRRDTPGLSVVGDFDGLGLRGNGSRPMVAKQARVPRSALLGEDGAGLDLAMSAVLPTFLLLNAAAGVGLMEAVTEEATAHVGRVRLEHLGQSLAQRRSPAPHWPGCGSRPTAPARLLEATLAGLASGGPEASLKLLQIRQPRTRPPPRSPTWP